MLLNGEKAFNLKSIRDTFPNSNSPFAQQHGRNPRTCKDIIAGQPIAMLTIPWWGDAGLSPPKFLQSPRGATHSRNDTCYKTGFEFLY